MKVVVEGSIGAGKSALLTAVENALQEAGHKLPVLLEPVEHWRASGLLDSFYADMKKYAFPFSLQVLLSHQNAHRMDTVITERCPDSCCKVFTKIAATEGYLTQAQHEVFQQCFETLTWDPDLVLFLDTPIHVCLHRMELRGRSCESSIDSQYLRKIQHRYDILLEEFRQRGIAVYKLDGSLPLEDLVSQTLCILQQHVLSTSSISPSSISTSSTS